MKRFEHDLAIVVEYCKENIWEWETRDITMPNKKDYFYITEVNVYFE